MRERFVLGLDVSLASTGLVLMQIVDRKPIVRHTETIVTRSDEHMSLRQLQIVERVIQIVNVFGLHRDDVAVAIEDYGSSKIRGKLYERIELTGMVKFCLMIFHGFTIYAILPLSLKAFMGATSKKKQSMKDAVLVNFGFRGGNEHIRDAYALCRYFIAYRLGMKLRVTIHPPMMYMRDRLQPSANKPGRLRLMPLTTR